MEEFKRILDEMHKKNMPYKEIDNEKQFKVKLNLNTKIVDINKKFFKIVLRKVPVPIFSITRMPSVTS